MLVVIIMEKRCSWHDKVVTYWQLLEKLKYKNNQKTKKYH